MHGVCLPDPHNSQHFGYTILASYTVDTPETTMIAGVCRKTLPVTMVMFKQFGNPFQYKPHTASTILAQLHVMKSNAVSSNLSAYIHKANKF